jgi:hypothetical protein
MIVLLLGAAAFTQSPTAISAPASPELSAAVARQDEALAEVAASPPGRSLDFIAGPAVALDISETKSNLTLTYNLVRRTERSIENGRALELRRNALRFEASLPIGGTDNLLSGDTFDGLADGASLGVSWSSFGATARDRFDDAPFQQVMERAVERCATSTNPPPPPEGCEIYRTHPRAAFARTYSGYSPARINQTLLSSSGAFGLEARVGFKVFSYRTPVTLVENSVTRPQFSLKAHGSYFPSDGVSAVTASFEYQNEFEARHEQILCHAVIVNANDDCVNARSGPPNNVEKLLFALEYRRVLGGPTQLGQFAIAPQATFDAVNNEFEISLPIYLRPRGDLGFLPGVTISYNSEHDEVTVGVFLKRSFSF